MIVPDLVSPIVAYRAWRWDGTFLRSLNNTPWPVMRAMKAACKLGLGPSQSHDAPDKGCKCGIYAAKDLRHLHDIGYINENGIIHGEVSLWGRVWEHRLGYRAEHACIKSLVISLPMSVHAFNCLAAYNVDILASHTMRNGKGQDEARTHLIFRKDQGPQCDGGEFHMQGSWYVWNEPLRTLAVGDHVAICVRGMGIVEAIRDMGSGTDVTLRLGNFERVIMNSQMIYWEKAHNRWESASSEYWRQVREEFQAARRRLLGKYRSDPAGIRNHLFMADVCLFCAANDVERISEGFGPNRQCRTCGSSWYVNHCWNCMSGKVDSRDPETAPCPACNWLKCAQCDACTDSPSGCPRLYVNPASCA